ncbi:Predicted ATP-dependent protease [Roseovarius litoreus]|uniref:endopeptidase La n=1 Tax=Roseovarius litoreus TaxID=1155722 RepID=A0A1M6ZFP9_9RHOB|nr:ATP-binding protein [Roseovarius litoreus]SHL29173.1 Predicted ATP-dependent protease [Roseovarius litoreus]
MSDTSDPADGPELPQPLAPERLCVPVTAADFDFATTADLAPDIGWLGQERAVDAIRMAADIPHGDFNAFVLGTPGSGRHRIVRAILAQAAEDRERPSDWVYVNNFDAPDKPRAIELPPGQASRFCKAMEHLIDELANDIPAIFESEDYQTRRNAIEQEFADLHEAEMSQLFERARGRGVAILRTPMGFTVAGLHGGEVLTPDKYEALSEDEQARVDAAVDQTQGELAEVLKAAPAREKQHRARVETLNVEMATAGVDAAIAEVAEAFRDHAPVRAHLDRVRADLIENAQLFLIRDEQMQGGPFPGPTSKHYARPQFQRYAVNVMVAHDGAGQGDAAHDTQGAPVIEESLPTLGNLIGRIEYASEMGALVTNFTMIKPGALHRANGGFLVLDALHVLQEPFAWDALKRCLRTGEISIYSPGERLSLISTVSLDPDPIPLKTRVVLVGERLHYYLLAAFDPDFAHLFKLQADLNDHMPAGEDHRQGYARMLGSLAHDAGIRPLEPGAVAATLRESTRLAGDAERFTLDTDTLSDILREADHWADGNDHSAITAADIDRAIAERDRRASRLRDLSHEAITRQTVLIDTDGARIGQINALSVLQIGAATFGRPSRLTARTRMGSGKLVDIERETELGGPIHSKGVLILQGYLASSFATDAPMSLWASLVFEQSYGGVDGDSASAAELLALISSLAEAPIDQSFAITGSVNQFGDIQAIGGVNEKIEGFFDICAARGLTGRQGVLIPAANVKHLALRARVIDAVRDRRFRILPMRSVSDAIAVLMGASAGVRGPDGAYPEGSINARVEARLRAFAEARRAYVKQATEQPGGTP